jgi:CRISPR-associated endonuclease/helicase Cas3
MMVTFVSQCEKNALNKTRRVLDSFANRIGTNVWQTLITEEGLQAVKKLLRKTATKNTAVSCHRIHGYNRSELDWIVGNRSKFNSQGFVPVHTTKQIIINTQYENDWQYLPLIKCLTALAALFHDWGKASACFQQKLKSRKPMSDPLRHEWVSCLLLHAFVNGEKEDSEWLARLTAGEINEIEITKNLAAIKNPLKNLPPLASLCAWLILSHHRLPRPEKDWRGKTPPKDFNQLLSAITADFGYQNSSDISECLIFPNGLPNQSQQWLKDTKKWATKTALCEALAKSAVENGAWRLVLHHARLALMLGDHFYSSQDADKNWRSKINLFANTDKNTHKLKQKLDEHLVGVVENALKTAHLLPQFESELPFVSDIRALKKKSPPHFFWQDVAVTKIKAWRESEATQQLAQFGFFAVNMASTGKGKTFANAKIMRALSPDFESLRYVLALGLRTLTLQTGDEYRNRIGLDSSELAVLIGSKAVMELHQQNKQETKEKELSEAEKNGSESDEELLDGDIEYDCKIPEEGLATVLRIEKDRQFLYAPVLACTIDHLMAATETIRGGKYILPSLRLMSSDLVIDEIDDFDGDDLIAIGRLIHLAGMLGRKVMISSATIPPDLAEGYFNAYQAGWRIFSASRDIKKTVGCAWIDEFTTQTQSLNAVIGDNSFHEHHAKFITKRVKKLIEQPVKRIGEIISLESLKDDSNNENKTANYYEIIAESIIEQHSRHFKIDPKTGKNVSFGVVRMANISPCVELAEFLMQREWENDVDVKIMAYHSQQVMLMRSEQEKHLDAVLKRENPNAAFDNSIIRQHLTESGASNVIFIVVATPVEEVGRDHDFDFAIVEPSSYRSIIQLAGRVLRHRHDEIPTAPNISLLQYNLKGFDSVAIFCERFLWHPCQ